MSFGNVIPPNNLPIDISIIEKEKNIYNTTDYYVSVNYEIDQRYKCIEVHTPNPDCQKDYYVNQLTKVIGVGKPIKSNTFDNVAFLPISNNININLLKTNFIKLIINDGKTVIEESN